MNIALESALSSLLLQSVAGPAILTAAQVTQWLP